MDAPRSGIGGKSLDALGIGAEEEKVYRLLLAKGMAAVDDIARGAKYSRRKTQRLLESIETKGLATRSPERRRRYIPISPELAVEALIIQRKADLERTRALIPELKTQAAQLREADREQMVELVSSRRAERQIFEQMQSTATREVITLIRPPMRVSQMDLPPEDDRRVQRSAQARGVRYRSVVDDDFLALPGAHERVRADLRSGEEVRVFAQLPFKMFLSDQRMALIPLRPRESDSPSLLVRSSALLDALYALFEMIWERAAPVSFSRRGELNIQAGERRVGDQFEVLVSLLAAGLPDKAVASQLGMSGSTFNRRIVELMKALDARTRFQLGWLCASRFRPPGED